MVYCESSRLHSKSSNNQFTVQIWLLLHLILKENKQKELFSRKTILEPHVILSNTIKWSCNKTLNITNIDANFVLIEKPYKVNEENFQFNGNCACMKAGR